LRGHHHPHNQNREVTSVLRQLGDIRRDPPRLINRSRYAARQIW
jgi:phage host-nuclease inhibitor protein Gam